MIENLFIIIVSFLLSLYHKRYLFWPLFLSLWAYSIVSQPQKDQQRCKNQSIFYKKKQILRKIQATLSIEHGKHNKCRTGYKTLQCIFAINALAGMCCGSNWTMETAGTRNIINIQSFNLYRSGNVDSNNFC